MPLSPTTYFSHTVFSYGAYLSSLRYVLFFCNFFKYNVCNLEVWKAVDTAGKLPSRKAGENSNNRQVFLMEKCNKHCAPGFSPSPNNVSDI